MTPASGNNRLPAPRPRSRDAATARQVWWASVPVWSIGFLSPVPFLVYAIIHRTRRDWAVFAGYLAATVVMLVALGASGSNGAATAGVGGFIIALAGLRGISWAGSAVPTRCVPTPSSPPAESTSSAT